MRKAWMIIKNIPLIIAVLVAIVWHDLYTARRWKREVEEWKQINKNK